MFMSDLHGLPRRRIKAGSLEGPKSAQRELGILVVDDELQVQRIIGRVLEGSSVRLDVALDGEDALRKIFTGGYDLVLTDLKHGGARGEDIVRCIKLNNPLTQVMVLTGAHQVGDYGQDETLYKPFGVAVFLGKIEEARERAVELDGLPPEEIEESKRRLEEDFRRVGEGLIEESGWSEAEAGAYLREFSGVGLRLVPSLSPERYVAMTNVDGVTLVNLSHADRGALLEAAPFVAVHELMEFYFKKGFAAVRVGGESDGFAKEAAVDWAAIQYSARKRRLKAVEGYLGLHEKDLAEKDFDLEGLARVEAVSRRVSRMQGIPPELGRRAEKVSRTARRLAGDGGEYDEVFERCVRVLDSLVVDWGAIDEFEA